MYKRRGIHHLWLLVFFLILTLAGRTQSSQDFGDFVVHYNAMNASLLPPPVARQYNLQRSASRGLINITVMEKVLDLPNRPVHAMVKVTARNLSGQMRYIDMREIEDQGAIYYIGLMRVRDQEVFDIRAEVVPDGKDEPLVVEFRQQFFTEN